MIADFFLFWDVLLLLILLSKIETLQVPNSLRFFRNLGIFVITLLWILSFSVALINILISQPFDVGLLKILLVFGFATPSVLIF